MEEFGRGMRARAGHHQRIAVRRGLGDAISADDPAGARNVFDDNLLAERLRHRAYNHPRRGVRGTARRKWRNKRDDPIRIVLRERTRNKSKKHQSERKNSFQSGPPPSDIQLSHYSIICDATIFELCKFTI